MLKADNQGEVSLDWLKWLVALVLLLAGLVANQYYSEISMPIRTLGWLVIMAVAGFIASKTQPISRPTMINCEGDRMAICYWAMAFVKFRSA